MSAVPADWRMASPWRQALPAFLLLVAVIGLLYRGTVAEMADIWWRSETFAHCLLVLPISLWLVWRKREQLRMLAPQPQPAVLLALLAVALIWLLAKLVVVNAAAQFALVAMLVLAVPAVLGRQVTMVILFPLLFLFFGVPFGEFVLPTMMEWTASFTVSALQFSGVPVYREGQQFFIPTGSWSVIDECSGVRYLMASFMVGTLFGYLNYRSYKRRAVFMAVSIVVPVLANWLRAYLIVMLAHLSGNRIAAGVDHVLYGWVFFGFIVFIMFMVGARWAQPDEVPASAAAGSRTAPLAGAGSFARSRLASALVGVLVVLLPHLTLAGLERVEGASAPAHIELPARLASGWSSAGAQLIAWTPAYGEPSAASARVYAAPAGTVGVYLAYYRGQRDDHKLVSSQNMLVGMRDPQWNIPVADGILAIDVGAGQTVAVRSDQILGRAQLGAAHRPQLVVWRLYWVDGRFIAGDAAAKVAGALARLRGHGDEGAAIVLYADAETVPASNAALQAFVQANLASLNALLQQTLAAR